MSQLSRQIGFSVLFVACVGTLWGQSYRTWDDGHGSDDWSQKNNWSANNKPGGSTEVARFSNGNAGSTSIDINKNQRTGGMLFDANLTIDITFTRVSTELSIRNGGGNYGIKNNSDQTITFQNQMGIENDMTWATSNVSGGGLVFETEIDTDGHTLTLDTTNAANFITVSGTIIDAGDIIKTGAGTLTLSGTNTFTGAIDVNGGVLSISSQENLGSLSASADLTLNGGTLRIDGGSIDNDDNTRNLVLGAGGGTIDTVLESDTLIWDNDITGSGSLTKIGAGTLRFDDPTSFTGDLNINEGLVEFGGGDNRLADTVDVSIASGATLDVRDRSDDFGSLSGAGTLTSSTASTETVGFGLNNNGSDVFSGTITDGASATLNIEKLGTGNTTLSGNNSFEGTTTVVGGTLTLASNTALGSAAAGTTVNSGATLALTNNITIASEAVTNSGTVTNTSGTNTFGGIISGSGSLTTTGGQLTLSGANDYTGTTTVGNGSTLVAANNTALGTIGTGTTVNSGGTLALTNNIAIGTEAITNSGTVTNTSGTNSLAGVISGSGTVTTTGGELTLTGTNTYTGDTTINSGSTLVAASNGALGNTANDTTVNSGGTLALTGGVNITQANVSLAGSGSSSAGAIQNIAGTNTLLANFDLTADTTIKSVAGTLNLGTDPGYNDYASQFVTNNGNDLTFTGDGDTNLFAGLTGSGNLIKTGTGTLTIEGTPNPDTATFTGTTAINDGALVLATLYNDTPGVGPLDDFFIRNDITVGDGTGSAGSATLTMGKNDAGAGNNYANIFDTGVNLTVNADGAFDTRGHTQYITDLNLDGGSVNAQTAGLTGNNLFIQGDLTSTNTSQIATIDGYVDFNSDASKSINVSTGSTLDINARIQNGGIDKTGNGTVILSGGNTFTDNVDVLEGIVRVDNNIGLGAITGGTNVSSGAQLQIDGVAIGAEALSLNGTGVSNDGALQTVVGSGANSWAGNITVASLTEIEVSSGSSLAITGDITGAVQTLTIESIGDTTLSGANELDTLTKTGAGNLTITTGDNEFSTVNVDAGTFTVGTTGILIGEPDLNVGAAGSFAMGGGIDNTIDQFNSSGTLDIDGILTMNGGTISGGSGAGSTGELILTAGNTLNITSDFDFGGTLELTANTTLALAGDGSQIDIGTLKITGDTVIDFGDGENIELNLGSLQITGTNKITVNNWVSFQDLWTTGSFTGGSGSVTIDEQDSNTAQITFNGFGPADTIWVNFDFGANEITVPEPSSYGALLMTFGLAGWMIRRRRRLA